MLDWRVFCFVFHACLLVLLSCLCQFVFDTKTSFAWLTFILVFGSPLCHYHIKGKASSFPAIVKVTNVIIQVLNYFPLALNWNSETWCFPSDPVSIMSCFFLHCGERPPRWRISILETFIIHRVNCLQYLDGNQVEDSALNLSNIFPRDSVMQSFPLRRTKNPS